MKGVQFKVNEATGNISVVKSNRATAKLLDVTENVYETLANSMMISGRTLSFTNPKTSIRYKMCLVELGPGDVS